MNAMEVIFTTWVGWPIYTGFAFLLGTAVWEKFDEKSQNRRK